VTARQRKARRSAAAKKGWETRRALKEARAQVVAREIEIDRALEALESGAVLVAPGKVQFFTVGPRPSLWRRIAANLKQWALSPAAWFRRNA
jgi:hypothetical protein